MKPVTNRRDFYERFSSPRKKDNCRKQNCRQGKLYGWSFVATIELVRRLDGGMQHEVKAKSGIYGRDQGRKKVGGDKEADFRKTEVAGQPPFWIEEKEKKINNRL